MIARAVKRVPVGMNHSIEPEPSKLYENASETAPLRLHLLRSARFGHSSWVRVRS